MTLAIGLDIGGSKIAAAAYDENGVEKVKSVVPTPRDYPAFLKACADVVASLAITESATIGAGMPNGHANLPFLVDHPIRLDLERRIGARIALGNDANCAALAEAMEGAGKGFESVFGLILGTGVGGGFIFKGQIVGGANGIAGEIGHVPLPYYEDEDGEPILCGCGQKCLEKLACGAGLARLFKRMTGREADGEQIAFMAERGDADALRVLDRFYTVVAKAMVVVLHSFDPDVITVSGGLSALPRLYEEVPKRWGRFALAREPKTKFVPARFGSMAGLRGAAWLGKTVLADDIKKG